MSDIISRVDRGNTPLWGRGPPPLSRFQVNGVSAASVPAGHASSVHTQHYMAPCV